MPQPSTHPIAVAEVWKGQPLPLAKPWNPPKTIPFFQPIELSVAVADDPVTDPDPEHDGAVYVRVVPDRVPT